MKLLTSEEFTSLSVIGNSAVLDRPEPNSRSQAHVLAPPFERGMKGIYQHCSEKHLHRHLEFDFRYSNQIALGVDDQDRADKVIKGWSASGGSSTQG